MRGLLAINALLTIPWGLPQGVVYKVKDKKIMGKNVLVGSVKDDLLEKLLFKPVEVLEKLLLMGGIYHFVNNYAHISGSL